MLFRSPLGRATWRGRPPPARRCSIRVFFPAAPLATDFSITISSSQVCRGETQLPGLLVQAPTGLAKLVPAIGLAAIVGAVSFGERRWYAAAPGQCILFHFARQRGRTGPAQRCAWPRLRVLPLRLLLPLLCEEGRPSVHQNDRSSKEALWR